MFEVYDGVPVPPVKRPSGPRKYPVRTMTVGQMFFVTGRKSRSVGAYIARITKDIEAKFIVRHCWVVFKDDKPVEVPEGTPGAEEGTGVWRTE